MVYEHKDLEKKYFERYLREMDEGLRAHAPGMIEVQPLSKICKCDEENDRDFKSKFGF